MMIINFLTGSLAFREHKTGVHYFHEMLIKKTLDHKKFDICVSFYDREEDVKQYIPEYEKNKSIHKFSSKKARLLAYVLPIEKIFGESDVYICDGLIPIVGNNKKRVAIIFDLMVKVFPEYYKIPKKVYLNYYFNKCKKADVIITISQTTKKDIIHYLGIPEEKIVVVPCGYIENNNSESVGNEFLEKLKEKYLFYVGDMRKNKNLLMAIKGFEKAYEQNKELKFYIAGKKSDEYEFLFAYVKERNLQNTVIFLGYISDAEKKALYKNSLALLFVSQYEGFGIPILEAAFNETPVITSDCSSMKEIAEGSAILVNPYEPEEIKKAILNLCDNEYRKGIIERQKVLINTYSWENMYLAFEKAIDDL